MGGTRGRGVKGRTRDKDGKKEETERKEERRAVSEGGGARVALEDGEGGAVGGTRPLSQAPQRYVNPSTRNRTRDHLIAAELYSQMLYQLSYRRLVNLCQMMLLWKALLSCSGLMSCLLRSRRQRCVLRSCMQARGCSGDGSSAASATAPLKSKASALR